MEYTITIYVSSDDPQAPITEFVSALETLLSWQWDNVALTTEARND